TKASHTPSSAVYVWSSGVSCVPGPPRLPARATLLRDLQLLDRLMAHRRREHDLARGNLRTHGPQMEQDPVRFGRDLRQRLRFLRRDIQDLHPPGRDFLLMVMEVLVPLLQRHVGAREFLVNEVFDFHQLGVGLGREEDQALHDLGFNRLTIVMIGTVDRAIFMAMGGHDVDGVALGGTAWWLLRTQRGRSDEHDTAEHHEPTGLHPGLLSEVRGVRDAANGKVLLTPVVTRGPVDSTIPGMAVQSPSCVHIPEARTLQEDFPYASAVSGRAWHRASKAARGEDGQMEKQVVWGKSP